MGRGELGADCAAETARRYKMNWRSVLKRESEVRGKEVREVRGGREKKEKESQRGKRGGSVQGSVWCACGCEQRRQVRRGSVTDGPCGSLDVTSFVKCEELPVSQHQGLNPRQTSSVPAQTSTGIQGCSREGARQGWVPLSVFICK